MTVGPATGPPATDAGRLAHQDSPEILHTGDIVLLKVSVQEDLFAEAGQASNDTGFVTADGIRGEVSVVPAENVEGTGLDVREFMFVVVDQLSYLAQRDLVKRRKVIESQNSGSVMNNMTSKQLASLKTYELRAQIEKEQNASLRNSQRRPLYYGDIIQLQHLRTQRFVGTRNKMPSKLQRTSRTVDLQEGNSSCWLQLNPFFRHKMQGQPIALGEQVMIGSVKLANEFSLNWFCTTNEQRNMTYEVNCAFGGKGFYFNLYSRQVPVSLGSTSLGLSYGLSICMFYPHIASYISASCSPLKRTAYFRALSHDQSRMCSKSIWVIEHISSDTKEHGILWNQSPVYLRHFASGRYLAVSSSGLKSAGMLVEEVEDPAIAQMGVSPSIGSPKRQRASINKSPSMMLAAGSDGIATELVDLPGPCCVFTLEATSILKTGDPGEKTYVPRDNACLMLRWDNPGKPHPLWLSCPMKPKGKRTSFAMVWSEVRYSRDAVRLEVMDENPMMIECDVVAEHAAKLRRTVTPMCQNLSDPDITISVCGVVEHMLSDMIHFLSDSPKWRSMEGNIFNQPDALEVPWAANPLRQQLARELKYVDSTFDLFHVFVKQTPSLTGDVDFTQRNDSLALTDIKPNSLGWGPNQGASPAVASQMKTRCLKLLVRLWLYCFIYNRVNEDYFFKNGWMATLNSLNGQGLGASGVFVALISYNAKLIRAVDRATMMKFISFIRLLGPMDTWLQFLAALCAPQGVAMFLKQQAVLTSLIFAGHRAPVADRQAAAANRKELLVSFAIGTPLAISLGPPSAGGPPPPLEECLAHNLLTEGIYDIAICWTAPDEWIVGQGVLFHGPERMGLTPIPAPNNTSRVDSRKWVSLADVVWVLQPEKCCELVIGCKWEDARARDGGEPGVGVAKRASVAGKSITEEQALGSATASRLDLLRSMAKYILAQLQLTASMVVERQMNCIMGLQDEYMFGLCLSGTSDPRLPTCIRAAFCNITKNLWLDRHPHVQVFWPSLMRYPPDLQPARLEDLPAFSPGEEQAPESWSPEHLQSMGNEVRWFYRYSTPHKMEALLRALRRHLCAGPMVEQQVHSAHDDNSLTISVLALLSHLVRVGFVHSAGIIFELIGPLLRLLDGRTDLIVPLSLAPRRSVGGASTSLEMTDALAQNVSEPLLSKVAVDTPMAGERNQLTLSRFPPNDDSQLRYVSCDANLDIMQSKVTTCQVILQMTKAGLHIKISRILYACRLHIDETRPPPKEPPEVLVAGVLKLLDDPVVNLVQPGCSRPDVLCIDLMMYEHPELFSLGLEMLYGYYMQNAAIMKHLETTIILSQAQLSLFKSLKNDVSQLGKLINSFENWGVEDQFSTVDNQKFQLFQRLCLKIRNLCHLGDANTRPAEVQGMLHETELFGHVSYVLDLNPNDFTTSSQGLLARVVALMCSVAAQLVSCNSVNQVQAFSVLHKAVNLLPTHPDSALFVSEIFRHNMGLCQEVKKELIVQYANLILRERQQAKFVPWYLVFYRTIVAVGVQPLPANQSAVVAELRRIGPHNMLHLLQGEDGLKRIEQLAKGFKSVSQLQNPEVSRGTSGDDAEFIYYVRSLELVVGLAFGTGPNSLVSKPFASMLFPAPMAFQLLLSFDGKPDARTDGQFSVHRYLKIRWLQLAQVIVYDVDGGLLDLSLLSSALHVQFLTKMLGWVEAVLQMSPATSDYATGPKNAIIDEEEEEYLDMMLRCIDCFFGNCFLPLRDSCLSNDIILVANEYARRLGPLTAKNSVAQHVGLRDTRLLQVAVSRVVNTLSNTGKGAYRSHVSSSAPKLYSALPTPGQQVQWQKVVDMLKNDPRVTDRMKKENEELGNVFLNISSLTDPELPEYLKIMPQQPGGTLPPGYDFRRGLITTPAVLQKMVEYASPRVKTDLESIRRICHILLAILQQGRQSADTTLLAQCHDHFVSSGVTSLLIRFLDANPAEDITEMSWTLLAELLQTREGVNKNVQLCIITTVDVFDDSGMWQTFSQQLKLITRQAKSIRALRLLSSLSSEEKVFMTEYDDNLSYIIKAMEAVRLTVEGHLFPMQQYLFEQHDNKVSFNIVEMVARLFIRMSKDQAAADMMNELEMNCMSCALSLLIELTQGPNERNQELLSTLGLIEAVFKMLSTNFERLRRGAGDVYPTALRKLKAQAVGSLLTLLEGRQDNKIHKILAERVDAEVLHDRLEFVYLYFVFGASGVAKGEIQCEGTAAVPLDCESARLVMPAADQSEVYAQMKVSVQVAEELLEDLDDLELDELFSEALDVLALIYQLIPHSSEFEKRIMPLPEDKETFQNNPQLFVTEREFILERTAYHSREIYRHAFKFMSQFVLTIEVMLNGQLQTLHFQRPLTEMWYVHGQAKDHIQNSVPLGSSDVKMKSFISMCQKTHTESKLVRRLSRFSIVPVRYAKWAQRNLWDGMHRPFVFFFKDDAKNMSRSMTAQLMLGFALSMHTGTFLVPAGKAPPASVSSNVFNTASDDLTWSSPLMEQLAHVMGCLYIGFIGLWLVITCCLKSPLNYLETQQANPSYTAVYLFLRALYDTLTSATILWRIVLMFSCAAAIVYSEYWLYCFLLGDFFCQNSSLGNVLGAIVNKGYSLSMTFIGSAIITYVYAGFAYHYFRDDFGEYCEESILICSVNILYQGTRNGIIGLSSMMDEVMPDKDKFAMRVFFDVSYYVVFGIMLLNTIVALIVDSFSALRMDTEARDHNNETQTFISCIDRKVIETVAQGQGIANGWEYHETRKQNKWDYMAFIFHLREKDMQDYTGPEQAIRAAIENKDVKWLPVGRSMMLEADEEHGAKEDILTRIENATSRSLLSLQAAKEHRGMMTRALTTMSSHTSERFDAVDEELGHLHASINNPRKVASLKAMLAAGESGMASILTAGTPGAGVGMVAAGGQPPV